ncbi:succinate dehydrogenase, hydrophobic membrane anchor protein [Stappia sp. BW2]|uniref:succinate dehydrogenase, hydrophobic membrane anchor protein n=1 Tax=Stappia sp. BW2 TaxID=2592622 RepID=UPI0011DEA22B|nr:succinate dehydrogenase, hydrophobic membrane anchor protein [Stappia sp. BW2]TYC64064.1 succinate dehydrogenase, hydrophobic membrane anchor protein [Stappia sp. BW2]
MSDAKNTDKKSKADDAAKDTAKNDDQQHQNDKQKDEIKVARTQTDPSLLTRLAQRTAYRRATALGASGTGAAIWTVQRMTALALIPLALWFLVSILSMLHAPATTAAAWLGAPWNAALIGAFVLVALRHGTIGFRVILEDYVHSEGWRVASIALVYAIAALSALATVVGLAVLIFTHIGG